MLNPQDVMKVKARGFLRNRGTDLFSGRVVAPGTVFTSKQFAALAALAEEFGNGRLIPTSRQCIEVPGIPFEKIEAAEAFAAKNGLFFGGTGNKVRPVTACKGTTCVFGNIDTHGLAAKIYDTFYIGWRSVTLPHKFKIGVGGCPNSCIKQSLNDIGIEGCRTPDYTPSLCRGCKVCAVEKACPMKAISTADGKPVIDTSRCSSCGVCTGKCPFSAFAAEVTPRYRIFVGGTWGKTARMGTPLSRLFTADEVLPMIEKCLLWFRENGYAKERFGKAVDRLGIAALEAALLGDDLTARKKEILAADIKQAP